MSQSNPSGSDVLTTPFTTEDCLNREQGRGQSPKENILQQESVLPVLHNLILVEAYLAGGPVDIFRLWAEMYERQKKIDVGLMLFIRAIMHLEENGFMQKALEVRSGITGKGEMYLMALLLVGELSDEALERLANRGLALASMEGVV